MSKLEELAKAYAAALEAMDKAIDRNAAAQRQAREARSAMDDAMTSQEAARDRLLANALESGAHAITADQEPGA